MLSKPILVMQQVIVLNFAGRRGKVFTTNGPKLQPVKVLALQFVFARAL